MEESIDILKAVPKGKNDTWEHLHAFSKEELTTHETIH
jgi:hypothetical protein